MPAAEAVAMDGCGRETGQRGAAVVQARAPARGARIAQALKLRGVRKQQALASELNVHESAITRWKGGEAMSLENAVAFCAALDISADWLLLGRGTIEAHLGAQGGADGAAGGTAGAGAGAGVAGADKPILFSNETQAKLQAFIRALAGDFQRRA